MLIEHGDFVEFLQILESETFFEPAFASPISRTVLIFRVDEGARLENVYTPDYYFSDDDWAADGVFTRHTKNLNSEHFIDIDTQVVDKGMHVFHGVIDALRQTTGQWQLVCGGLALGGLSTIRLPLFSILHANVMDPESAYFRIYFEDARSAVQFKLTLAF